MINNAVQFTVPLSGEAYDGVLRLLVQQLLTRIRAAIRIRKKGLKTLPPIAVLPFSRRHMMRGTRSHHGKSGFTEAHRSLFHFLFPRNSYYLSRERLEEAYVERLACEVPEEPPAALQQRIMQLEFAIGARTKELFALCRSTWETIDSGDDQASLRPLAN